MTTDTAADGLRARISRQSEDALGKLAQELLESPFVSSALSRAFDAREKAAQAQEVAMGALNLPSAGDLERLTRRVRSVSQRLEGVEDALDRVDERVGAMGGAGVSSLEQRLNAIEGQLSALATQLADVAGQIGSPASAAADATGTSAPSPVAPTQRRTTRTRSAAASKRAAATRRS
jgi:chromosome segregation ATPase